MFNKTIKIIVKTRTQNEDNFKIERLVDTCKVPNTIPHTVASPENIRITFEIRKSVLKKFREHLELLNFVGVYGEIEDY